MDLPGRPDEESDMDGPSGSVSSIQSGRGRLPSTAATDAEDPYLTELGRFTDDNRDLLDRIQGTTFGPGRMYFSDVVACRDEGEAEELCAELVRRGEQYRGELIIIAIHGDHIHIVHDCPYSNRYVYINMSLLY